MPQHARRLKIRRKDLRKPDEFETLTGQVVAWAGEHQALVYGVVALAVVATIGALGVGRWRASTNQSAATAFRSAQAGFQAGKFSDAAPAFANIAQEYPRTPFGRVAGLYRAHALARQGDQANAITAYTEYLAGTAGAEYLRQQALIGLGRAREATGDATGALDAYTQASALKGPFQSDALLNAARLQEAAGHADQAQGIYSGLLKDDAVDPEVRAFAAAKVPGATVPTSATAEGTTEAQ
jgi:tetratricopeptide (TPR) repeat protein